MFETALNAGLPIIGVRTDDMVNFEAVVRELASTKVMRLPPNPKSATQVMTQNNLFWTEKDDEVTVELYRHFVAASKQLIAVNTSPNNLVFDAGELPVPDTMLSSALAEQVHTAEIRPLMRVLRGLSLKAVMEVLAITQSRTGGTKPAEVRLTRTMVMGTTQGLAQVDTAYEFYWWPTKLKEWVDLNQPYFLADVHPRLIPRGVLLHGDPGVGKTMGAKAIAKAFEVPLYRMDMATTLVRYMGDSEARFARALEIIEREAPCVVLIDEVEKLFGSKDDSGVIQRLLSQLLWWLAEHKSRVFTVMTSNDIDIIPKELYRAGRIDRSFQLFGLRTDKEVEEFAQKVYQTVFPTPANFDRASVLHATIASTKLPLPAAHASVAELVYQTIKTHQWI
jgi:hypothetical protein